MENQDEIAQKEIAKKAVPIIIKKLQIYFNIIISEDFFEKIPGDTVNAGVLLNVILSIISPFIMDNLQSLSDVTGAEINDIRNSLFRGIGETDNGN